MERLERGGTFSKKKIVGTRSQTQDVARGTYLAGHSTGDTVAYTWGGLEGQLRRGAEGARSALKYKKILKNLIDS